MTRSLNGLVLSLFWMSVIKTIPLLCQFVREIFGIICTSMLVGRGILVSVEAGHLIPLNALQDKSEACIISRS